MTEASPPSGWLPRVLLGALALLFVAVILGEVGLPGTEVTLRYKTLARVLALVWLACLATAVGRRDVPYRTAASDVPLACFMAAAALSVAFGGGHWGDVRQLLAAIGVGLLARTLFAPPARRGHAVGLLAATLAVLIGRELWVHPDLLPPHEMGRYDLVCANPNVLGFLFAMTAPYLLGAALGRRGAIRLIAAFGYALAVLGVLLTFSRVATVGLAAGSLVVVVALARPGRALVVASVLGLTFVASSRPDQWLHLRQSGDSYRPSIMATALRIGLEHPVLGVGFGINNLEEVFPDRYQALYGERIFRFHSANQVLDLLAGTGFVGTALAIWWMTRVGATVIGGWRDAPTAAGRTQAAGGVGTFVAIVLMSMAEPPLYAGKLLPFLFVVLAAIELGPSERPAR
jgi:hypothetical protein